MTGNVRKILLVVAVVLGSSGAVMLTNLNLTKGILALIFIASAGVCYYFANKK
jgi:hypothetical protein